jgi:hypothetical protein
MKWKQMLYNAGLGDAPLSQEAFHKVVAANINQQINALRAEATAMGEKGGRIFAPMIDQMEKAAQNPDYSIPGNRYLTLYAIANGKRIMEIANQADDYKIKHGGLDAGFEKQIRNWIVDHPISSYGELKGQATGVPTQQQAPDMMREGSTATNPKTGERMIRQNGRWVPLL